MESGDLAMRLKEKVKGLGISSEAAMEELRDRLAIGAEDGDEYRDRASTGPHMIANWWSKGTIPTAWVPAVLRFIGASPEDARDEIMARLDISRESIDALIVTTVDEGSAPLLELISNYLRINARSWRSENRGIHSSDVWWWLYTARQAVQ